MTTATTMLMLNDLGNDADLITRHDDWLEEERKSLAANLDNIANELRAVILAQKIKRALQQQNLVAIQELIKDETGEVVDLVLKIMPLPSALSRTNIRRDNILDILLDKAQQEGWRRDGYDLKRSAKLRIA